MYQHSEQRFQLLQQWFAQTLQCDIPHLEPLVGDASFRRYFRCQYQGHNLIVMDAPPAVENIRPFIAIARAFARLGVLVPDILFADAEQGFMVLSDLGDELYQRILPNNPDQLYKRALESLLPIQTCQ